MKTDEFNKLTKEQAVHGIYLCAKNSKRLFDSAIHLEKIEDYGSALSLLVLSAEEAIKSTLFVRKLANIKTEEKIEKFFKEHVSKHNIARELYEDYRNFLGYFENLNNDNQDSRKELANHLTEFIKLNPTANDNDYKKEALNFIRKKAEERKKQNPPCKDELKWWKKAYALKNKGLYVDFRNGEWVNNELINEDDYTESKEIVENIVSVIHKILEIDMKNFVKLMEDEISST